MTPPREHALENERLARLIRTAARAFNRALTLRLHTHGITFGQWIFLRTLWKNDGLSQRELAELAGLTEPTTHKALVKLQEQGLIRRVSSESNRRRQNVHLTEEGWSLRDKLEPLAVEANNMAMTGLDETQQAQFRSYLLTLIDNLERDEAEAALQGKRVPPTRGRNGEI